MRGPAWVSWRQPRPGLDDGLRHQPLQQRADRLGAQEHRLHQAARVQQPVGEDMAAVGVGAKLDLVHRQELGVPVERHRLHRAGEPARLGRDDLFLPGDQRDVAGALARHHAVVVLARQQAQREADDARGVREQRSMARCVLPVLVGPRTALTCGAKQRREANVGHGQTGF